MSTALDPRHPPPTVEERYSGATNTSNLKVEARRQLPADLLIAAGWSPTRLGAALLRLHSEWDGAEKPHRPTKERIDRIIASLPRIKDGTRKIDGQVVDNMVADVKGGRRTANDWYIHEVKMLLQKLKTMPEVRQALIYWALEHGMEDREHLAALVLSWWLDHTCPACGGRGKELMIGAPVKSHRNCKVCKGTGETAKPAGMDGRLMLEHIGDCVTRARAALKQRLQGTRSKKEEQGG